MSDVGEANDGTAFNVHSRHVCVFGPLINNALAGSPSNATDSCAAKHTARDGNTR